MLHELTAKEGGLHLRYNKTKCSKCVQSTDAFKNTGQNMELWRSGKVCMRMSGGVPNRLSPPRSGYKGPPLLPLL